MSLTITKDVSTPELKDLVSKRDEQSAVPSVTSPNITLGRAKI